MMIIFCVSSTDALPTRTDNIRGPGPTHPSSGKHQQTLLRCNREAFELL